MNEVYAKISPVLIIISLILLVSACTGPKAQTAHLPDGLSTAMVPAVPLDAYLYIRQSQPTAVSGAFPGLPPDAAIQSVEAWAVPSGSGESAGGVLTFSAGRDASAVFALIPERPDLWKMLSGSSIYLVWGTGSGAEGLKSAVQSKRFVPLKEANRDAWNLMERLPGPPAGRPLAAGFVRTEDRLIDFMQKSFPGGHEGGIASTVKMAKIEMTAVAFYSTRVLQVADFLSPARLKDAGAGCVLVAKSSYPGVVISTALGQAASRLNIEKTEVDGKPAYYRAVDAPTGDKVHVFFNNSGQYIYVQGAADLSRGQQLFRWVWGSN